jgi:hypothetical protein
MALTWQRGVRRRIALGLRAFFEPHGTTDAQFDRFCRWPTGTTRQYLEEAREPQVPEVLEMAMRFAEPPATYFQIARDDGMVRPDPDPPSPCTVASPCCGRRLEFCPHDETGPAFRCPRDCVCHQ